MNKFLVLIMLACFGIAMAQEPVTTSGDKDLAALMAKVEGKPAKTSFTNDFKTEDANKKAASDAVSNYYQAILDGDLVAAYNLMTDEYREAVSLQAYLKKNRVNMEDVHVADLKFEGEECAQVSGTLQGTPDARMGSMKINLELRLLRQKGQWKVFSNPYNMMGFQHPKAKSIKYPCAF